MPPKTLRKCIERTLNSLSKDDFDRFRNELVKRQEEPRVLLNRVEGKQRWEVVNVMISTFTEVGVLEVTKELLEEIDLTQDAETLVKAAMEAGCCPPAAGGAAGAQTEERHFVEKHRDQLIQRVTCVDAILDALLKEDVLNQETYDGIRSQRTSQAKMRELYGGPLKAGEEAQDIFKKILKDQQPLLFKSLEKK
ncbi:apoptosis-associated speck-like protein containing a CARD [Leuresthes tenuis]|uniref:apoptosis-associated speck-like protein containing a CARD n=1 Tax=Leuresthes tenuis TaxID=355514 RepID=UPI003B511A11